jgi:hypothetical protein
MIKIVITIEEETPGVIRTQGLAEDVGGNPSSLEVNYTTALMKVLHDTGDDNVNFKLLSTHIPLTYVVTRKNDEHKDRD